MVLKIIGAILVVCGVIWVYDARRIIRKYFNGLGDQNEGALGLKLIGGFFGILGGLLIYFGWLTRLVVSVASYPFSK